MTRSFSVAVTAAASLTVSAVLTGLGPAPASAGRPLVVDDDGLQCGAATYRTLEAALAVAQDGDRITVCPGRYAGDVEVSRSVSIRGPVGAVAARDCLDPTPAAPDDLDLTRFAVVEPVEPTTDATRPLLTLAADDVEVAGLVLQGAVDEVPERVGEYSLYTPALATSGDHSGYRIHHNLFRSNTVGVELGSDGRSRSRVDHNCLRENTYGVANQRYGLSSALLDANTSFRTEFFAYEIGWGYAGTDRVSLRDNTSVGDGVLIYLENSSRTRVEGNAVADPRFRGVHVGGGNDGVRVADNEITSSGSPGSGAQGIGVLTPTPQVPERSTGILLVDNRISGFRRTPQAGSGIVLSTGATSGARILGNRLSDNQVAGLLVAPGNTDNLVLGNRALDNTTVGIRVAGTGNLLVGNVMRRNGVDAEDQTDTDPNDGTRLLNTWRHNWCETDLPTGAICGGGA